MELSGYDSSVTLQDAKEVKEVERWRLLFQADVALSVVIVVDVVEGSKSWRRS